MDSLQDQVQYLRGQLDAERQAHAEARRIIAALTQRIPELEAPREAPGEPERGAAPVQRDNVPPEPETGGERRSWWQRIFGE